MSDADALIAGYEHLTSGAAVVQTRREIVVVSGPEADGYLQGQLSQDLSRLDDRQSAWTLILQPQGRLDAFARVTRLGDELWLDVDAGVGASLVERLRKFLLRTKATVELSSLKMLGVRGPRADELAVPAGSGPILRFSWGQLSGFDIVGEDPVPPAGIPLAPHAASEALRIINGFPVAPNELDSRVIPAEAGIVGASVSFTKGCYTGQELVARIDSRGSNVPRHLRLLTLDGPAGVGDNVVWGSEHKQVGSLTSVAFSPQRGWVALAYIGRVVEPGSAVLVAVGDEAETLRAHVEPLPEVSA